MCMQVKPLQQNTSAELAIYEVFLSQKRESEEHEETDILNKGWVYSRMKKSTQKRWKTYFTVTSAAIILGSSQTLTPSHPFGTLQRALNSSDTVLQSISLTSIATFSTLLIAHSTSRYLYSSIIFEYITLIYNSQPFLNRRNSRRLSINSSKSAIQSVKNKTRLSNHAL